MFLSARVTIEVSFTYLPGGTQRCSRQALGHHLHNLTERPGELLWEEVRFSHWRTKEDHLESRRISGQRKWAFSFEWLLWHHSGDPWDEKKGWVWRYSALGQVTRAKELDCRVVFSIVPPRASPISPPPLSGSAPAWILKSAAYSFLLLIGNISDPC